jgi:hypothetical protein
VELTGVVFVRLLQHNFTHIYGIALRVYDMHEVQPVSGPSIQTDVAGLLIDGCLKHLLSQGIFNQEMVANYMFFESGETIDPSS